MTASFIAPAIQVCAFALGCAVIHAARAHAVALTRLLAAMAIVTAALLLFGASLACAPDDNMNLHDIITCNGA
ncbi:hypothetical protein [Methylobacterium pseudosasicola]|uniref:Uncharacterized protein n=1 Tax=Methylobacterium pseudosasicola TaxID=582667 RepID=A0A1I4UHV7_9HYPH|nr:hypothetical protein [Methylobacterium pseudosasicola]SFM88579.1 hypothetical protein SAMN05192568_107111 [Methylobacterium pseudosasicola]